MSDIGLDELDPIDYAVIEFPADPQPDGSALQLLRDLVDRGVIRILVRAQGVLTDAEFESEKARILGSSVEDVIRRRAHVPGRRPRGAS